MIAIYIAKAIEVDGFEVIKENFYDFFLEEACNMEGKALHLLEDLTYNFILSSYLLRGYLAWGFCKSRNGSSNSGNGGSKNLYIELSLYIFKLSKYIFFDTSCLFIISFLAVDLEDL